MSAGSVSDEVQAPAASVETYIPPTPTALANTTGNYWVNYTWAADSGTVTDSYNVSMNETWYNGTATFLNSSVGADNWSNITVWAWNATGDGNMSAGSVSDEVQAPAADATTQVTISLDSGWNLISVPLNLTSWKLGNESIVGDPFNVTPENSLTQIYRYNTTSTSFEMCTHNDGWDQATGSESFTELEPGRGYWAWAESCVWKHEV